VPDVGQLELVATQTYSDGSVVKWDGSGDHPAPVLYVTDEPAGDHHAAVDVDEPSSAQNDVLARVFGIVGLALGAIAVAIAIVALRRATRGTK